MPAHDRARPVRTDARNKLTSPEYRPVLVTGILLVLMFVIGGVRYAGFVSPETVLNLLVDNAYLIVLAVGMTSSSCPAASTARWARWWPCRP